MQDYVSKAELRLETKPLCCWLTPAEAEGWNVHAIPGIAETAIISSYSKSRNLLTKRAVIAFNAQ